MAKEFDGKIKSELEAAEKKEQRFMFAFIVALVLIPVSILATNTVIEGTEDGAEE
ncbi:MAG: hypothetical protein ACK5MF_13685 [Vibrio sp.]|uniref:hypothetical protein n=1 Tax=Vibrio sp. TaxID=678 RepID=UPI003A845A47